MIRLDGEDLSIGDEPRALTYARASNNATASPYIYLLRRSQTSISPVYRCPLSRRPQSLTRDRQRPAREVIVEQRSQVPPGVDTLGAPTAARWLP